MLRGRFDNSTRLGPDRDSSIAGEDWWAGQSSSAKAGTACAVIFIALLVICGALLAWSRLAGTTQPAGSEAQPLTTTGATAATVAASSAPTAAANPATLTMTWQQVGLGALPFSAADGPRTVRGGVPAQFSHDGKGAVLAAVQILGRLSWAATSTATMLAVADADTTPSAQARAALTYAPPSDPSVIPAAVAYQLVSATADQASVDLALRFSGTLRVVPVSLLWTAGDWKLAGAPGPLAQTSWAAITDLTGFTPFTGQTTTGS
jgi:hypothetical protein